MRAADWQVRSAGPQDADLIREFVCGLSLRTQYFRFFTAASPPSSGLLRALTGDDSGRSDILVVTDARGAVIGHGMAVDTHRDGVLCSDIGLVIADSRQGHGLGTMLLSLLADRATRRGVTALVLDVLPDNARMLGIIDRRWPGASRARTLDAIVITAAIPGRQQASPARDWLARPVRASGARRGSGRSAA
jgi:GNAT superfamily N-acetyltransferase